MYYFVIMCVYVLFSAYASAFMICRLFHIYYTKMKSKKTFFKTEFLFFWLVLRARAWDSAHYGGLKIAFGKKNLSYSLHNFWKPMANPDVVVVIVVVGIFIQWRTPFEPLFNTEQ